jgi:hypothetical protein
VLEHEIMVGVLLHYPEENWEVSVCYFLIHLLHPVQQAGYYYQTRHLKQDRSIRSVVILVPEMGAEVGMIAVPEMEGAVVEYFRLRTYFQLDYHTYPEYSSVRWQPS